VRTMNPGVSGGESDSTKTGLSRYAPIIDPAPLPMVEVEGPNHVVCFVNASFCALLQRPREDLIGLPFADIVCNGHKCVELLDRVYRTGQDEANAEPGESTPACWLYAMWPAFEGEAHPERVVIQLTKANQFRQNAVALNEALLLSSLQQHELRAASEKSNASLLEEIAERVRAEAELQLAQTQLLANAEKLEQTVTERTAQLRDSLGELEAFAYSLAHDLRAPVRAIQGFTQIALEMPRGEVAPNAAELLHRVLKAAVRMDSLIQDVLDLSHVIQRPISLSTVDVNTLTIALVEERPELSPPRAEIQIESPLLPVLAHEATLSQCLTNLLSNAVKFVAPKIVPRVRIWSEDREGSGERRMVRLWIEDQGIGIAPENQERIFEIFQRLHSNSEYEGSGIGLAIVRKAVERMGGQVGVESGTVRGCRFWLELPKG
jgi:signal transduction histidine kinase